MADQLDTAATQNLRRRKITHINAYRDSNGTLYYGTSPRVRPSLTSEGPIGSAYNEDRPGYTPVGWDIDPETGLGVDPSPPVTPPVTPPVISAPPVDSIAIEQAKFDDEQQQAIEDEEQEEEKDNLEDFLDSMPGSYEDISNFDNIGLSLASGFLGPIAGLGALVSQIPGVRNFVLGTTQAERDAQEEEIARKNDLNWFEDDNGDIRSLIPLTDADGNTFYQTRFQYDKQRELAWEYLGKPSKEKLKEL